MAASHRQTKGRGPARDPKRGGPGRQPSERRRKPITATPGGALPRWVREEVIRSTGKERREQALRLLSTGVGSFAEERFGAAARSLQEAKALAPRAATIRELLGLSLYQEERWEVALRELRAFRRISGDTTHMAVEMDCLRALGRPADVEKTWALFRQLGGGRAAEDEARVVYASFLLERRELRGAWEVIRPSRLVADAPPSALRRWYVAARVAVASGDARAAAKIAGAIRSQAPDLPGLDGLEEEIAGMPR